MNTIKHILTQADNILFSVMFSITELTIDYVWL